MKQRLPQLRELRLWRAHEPSAGCRAEIAPIRGPEDFAAAFGVRVKRSTGLPSTSRCCGNGRRPSTWWRRARWTPSGTAISPTPPSSWPWPRGARTWVDLGSGAGFPGLVVAIMLAEVPTTSRGEGWSARCPPPLAPPRKGEGTPRVATPRITLIESNARKCAFLREVVRQTGIARASLWISCRQESRRRRLKLVCTGQTWFRRGHWRRSTGCLTLRPPYPRRARLGLFLKGRDAATELKAAEKMWNFNAELVPSRTEPRRPYRRDPQSRAQGQSEGMIP